MVSLVLLLLSFSGVLISNAQESIDERFYSLLGHGSYVELHSFQWVGEDRLTVQFTFQTHSYHGQLVRLLATNGNKESILEVKASIARRTVSIHAEDFVADSDPVANIRFAEKDVSDGLNHKLSITVDPNGDLLVGLDDTLLEEKIGLKREQAPFDTTIYIGGTVQGATVGPQSVKGCIGKFTVVYGSTGIPQLESKREGDVGDGCLDACKGSTCGQDNPTGCVNYHLEPICDCVGTHKEGTFCTEEPKTYNFDGDQYIVYDFGHHESERQPRRFYLSFKTQRVNDPSLLLYAPLAVDNAGDTDGLTAIVNNKHIEIRLRGQQILQTVFRHEENSQSWHDLTIEINYPLVEVRVKLDEEPLIASRNPSFGDVFFREVYIGGYKEEGLPRNFHGCIRSIYVDYLSISHLVHLESTRIQLGKTPIEKRCQSSGDAELPVIESEETSSTSTTVDSTTTETTTTTGTSTIQSDTESTTTTTPEYEHPPTFMFDEKQTVSTPSPIKVTCTDLRCEHGTQCVQPRAADAYCDCTGTGFVGKLCQFSNLPKSCDELYDTGEHRSGVFLVDPDGNGPMEPVSVKCVMDEQKGGTTYVDHNFVDGTYVRKSQQKDTVYLVAYRNMTPEALKQLIADSESCEQYFKYECNQAPLKLQSNTWLKSAATPDQSFSNIGGADDDQQCVCGRQRDCGILKCACDIGDKDTRSDEGYHSGKFAGVTEMTFVQDSGSSGWAKVTLGPLACKGSKVDDVIQFRKTGATLKFPKWDGKQLSFWFRTSVKNGRIFSQTANNGRFFILDLENGHTLSFSFQLREGASSPPVAKALVSQSPINDDEWHLVSVETIQGEIHFGLDNELDVFYSLTEGESLDENTFDQEFVFGGGVVDWINGFVGCVRRLILNNNKHNLATLTLPEGLSTGCQDNCKGVQCQNEAECVEDYEADSYKCRCINEYTHIGTHCEIDINKDTEVSFHSSFNAHVLVRDFMVNPVGNNRIIFSFRTDQTSAILLFSHDQNYNLVQIHLLEGNRISLTVNYEKLLSQCTIVKKQGDFNTMRWFQVVVIFNTQYTALFVDKDMCQIPGGRVLSNEYLEEWEGDIQKLRVVYPPRPPVPPSQMPMYTLLYVGGVRRAGIGHFQRRARRQSGQIVYTASLPNLLGCVRGFMVGNYAVDLRRANKSGNVQDYCNFGCGNEIGEGLQCAHGGYCKVAWEQDHRPTCDCVPTSYFGHSCTDDHGLHFDGTTFVHVHLELILQRVRLPEHRSYDSLSFAFSTSPNASSGGTQALAYIGVNEEKDVKVVLATDGQLVLEIKPSDSPVHVGQDDSHINAPYKYSFRGNYNDGKRHFVFLKFYGDKLVAKVDGHYHEANMVKWRLSDVRTVSIGGVMNPDRNEVASYIPYSGCMSNALIEFRSSIPYTIKPFDDLLNPVGNWQERYEKFLPEGSRLEPAQCAQFTAASPMVTEGPPTALPPFTEPMQTLLYVDATASPEETGGGGGVGVAIGLAVVVIVTLLCIAIYLYYVKCVKKRRRGGAEYEHPPESGGGEKLPVRPFPDTIRLEPDENLKDLPEANKDLDETSNRGSVTSPSPPPPYAPTATPATTPPHVAAKSALHPVDSLDNFALPPTDEELKALTPKLQRNPSVKRGAFVYGFPGSVAFMDSNENAPVSPRSPKSILSNPPSIPRRMPINVPIPNV